MSAVSSSPSQQILRHALSSDSDAERCYAAKASAAILATQCIDALRNCLNHQDPDVVIDAAKALGELHAGSASALLIDVVQFHPQGDARVSAAHALSQIADEQSLQKFLEWARGNVANDQYNADWNDDWDIQLLAIKTLAKEHYLPAISVLSALLEEEHLDLESDILNALCQLGPSGLSVVFSAIDKCGKTDNQHKVLRTGRRALLALAQVECTTSAKVLFKALQHPSEQLRKAAAKALGMRQCQEYFIDLIGLLNDSSEQVQTAALTCLINMQHKEGELYRRLLPKERLLKLLSVFNASGRTFVWLLLTPIANLLQMNDEQWQLLLKGVRSDSENEQIAACQLIAALADSRARDYLALTLKAKQCSVRVLREMLKTLVVISHNDTDSLLCITPFLQHHSTALRLTAFEALVALSEKPAKNPYISASFILNQALERKPLLSDEQIIEQAHPCSEDPDTHLEPTQLIPMQAIDTQGNPEPVVEKTTLSNASPINTASAVLDDSAAGSSDSKLSPPEQTPMVTSTLDSIQQHLGDQADQLSVTKGSNSAHENNAPHIKEMIDKLDEADDDYRNIVLSHLDNSEKINLSRKKIARHPFFDNQLLAIKSLANSHDPKTIDILLNLLLDCDTKVLAQVIDTLTLICLRSDNTKVMKNALGPICTLAQSGDEQLRLACIRAMAHMQPTVVLSFLIDALKDSNASVRIQAIHSINNYFSHATHTANKTEKSQQTLALISELFIDENTNVVNCSINYLREHCSLADRETIHKYQHTLFKQALIHSEILENAARTIGIIDTEMAESIICSYLEQPLQIDDRIKAIQILGLALGEKSGGGQEK